MQKLTKGLQNNQSYRPEKVPTIAYTRKQACSDQLSQHPEGVYRNRIKQIEKYSSSILYFFQNEP